MVGKLIVFEGVEGSGKSTQIELTRQWLEQNSSKQVTVTRQPGGTELGRELRRLLLEVQSYELDAMAELLLYAADRAQHIAQLIKPKLAAGTIVLCDRYTDSTIAYQGYGRGLDLTAIETLNRLATGGLEPDVTIWFDLDVEIGLNRARARANPGLPDELILDRLEQDTIDFHKAVQQGYRQLATSSGKIIHPVDASLSLEAVQSQIRSFLAANLS